ncbi:dihydropteroate synthase [Inhella sp.]|uniref:dihydropteroate synthase n=1 Tax=Inhella sp. TaxID=1921806 RepID=UPI0035B397A2
MNWQTTRFNIDLAQARVMGIVNLTADSFSDGGRWLDSRAALRHAEQLLREGAHLLDLGAESSRPGAQPVPAEQEWGRLQPVLRELVRWGVPLSVDTCKPEVMQRALDAGVDVINDIQALQHEGAVEVLARYPGAGVCLMHMRGEPRTMQALTSYADVVTEVREFLGERMRVLRVHGLQPAQIALDPGFGFAKTPEQNLELGRRLAELHGLGAPLLVGWSRKSTLGWLTGRSVEQRLPASLAALLAAVSQGARIVRVHDVAATVDALRSWQALQPKHGQSTP